MARPRITRTGSRPYRPAALAAVETKILKARIPERDQDNWCWAAVAVGVAEAYGQPLVPQCKVATNVTRALKSSTTLVCCPGAASPDKDCDRPRKLSLALQDRRVHDRIINVRTFDYVVRQIKDRRLVPVAMVAKNTAHFVVIAGYARSGTDQQLVVWDPETGLRRPVGFTEFRDRFRQKYSWQLTYVTAGGPADFETP